jgi:hypothetical protein
MAQSVPLPVNILGAPVKMLLKEGCRVPFIGKV